MNHRRRPLSGKPPTVVANWKMQMTPREALRLARSLRTSVGRLSSAVRLIVCPSFPAIPGVVGVLEGSAIAVGAQDVFWADRGAFTGQVSMLELRELGCRTVIVGHSERRSIGRDDNDVVARKVAAVIRHRATPILCVGESLPERRDGQQDRIVGSQVQRALRACPPPMLRQRLCIAYEPLWAIGTGNAIEPQQAIDMAKVIRQALVDLYGMAVVRRSVDILYGGSVNEKNVVDYVDREMISGVLVGGASLRQREFLALIRAVASPRPGKAAL